MTELMGRLVAHLEEAQVRLHFVCNCSILKIKNSNGVVLDCDGGGKKIETF